ncbi:hypothetical protein GGF50DRAFT_99359 [Schizophyllum commune]
MFAFRAFLFGTFSRTTTSAEGHALRLLLVSLSAQNVLKLAFLVPAGSPGQYLIHLVISGRIQERTFTPGTIFSHWLWSALCLVYRSRTN